MTTFFGIEAAQEEKFLEHGRVVLDKTRHSEVLNTFRSIRTEDIVFIKNFTPHTGLKVKAIGLSLSSFARENSTEISFPVEWVWTGETLIGQVDEELASCSNAFYEEHNILAQRKIMDLLPDQSAQPIPRLP
ncbi:MAG: hypothetical protein Q7S51_07290 [Gallionellaceae bacterium]|nr:hypothetical protein [Gallionellaceae bacterium]